MSADREDRLQQYLDGHLAGEERQAFEAELLADPDLMAETYDELAVRAALVEARRQEVARKVIRTRAIPRRRLGWAVPAAAVAAAACLAFIVLVRPFSPEDPNFRGDPDSGPRAVVPVGTVTKSPERFVWTRDPLALNYRLEIYDDAGERLFVVTTSDTFLVPVPEADLSATGSWRTTSLDSIGVGFRNTGRVEFELR